MENTLNKTLTDLRKVHEQILEKENYLNECLRNLYSRNLMDTSSDNPLECNVTLTTSDAFGLSTNGMIQIEEIWQHPYEGWIDMKIYGYEDVLSFDDFSNEDLIYIAEELWG